MAKIQGIEILTMYVDDFDKAVHFYQKFFGFEIKAKVGEKGCWGTMGAVNLYLEGGKTRLDVDMANTRASVALSVDSTFATFEEFKKGGVELLHMEPQVIGEDGWWFLFKDPAGNILEIYGEK